jgi:hypothetical protein
MIAWGNGGNRERWNKGMREAMELWKSGRVERCIKGIRERGNNGAVVPLEWSSEHAPVRLYVYIRARLP